MESSTASDAKQGAREEERGLEDVWSDLHALRRLYGLLHRSRSDADREEGHENCEKLDKKSRFLFKKLLDDATQQTIQSQAKLLCESPRKPTPSEKTPEPPLLTSTPDDADTTKEPRIAEELQHCHPCPTLSESTSQQNSVPVTQQKAPPDIGLEKLEMKCPDFERAVLKKQSSVKTLDGEKVHETKSPGSVPRHHHRHHDHGCHDHQNIKEGLATKDKRKIGHELENKSLASSRKCTAQNIVVSPSPDRQQTIPTGSVSGTAEPSRAVESQKRSRIETSESKRQIPKLDRVVSGSARLQHRLDRVSSGKKRKEDDGIKKTVMLDQTIQKAQEKDQTKIAPGSSTSTDRIKADAMKEIVYQNLMRDHATLISKKLGPHQEKEEERMKDRRIKVSPADSTSTALIKAPPVKSELHHNLKTDLAAQSVRGSPLRPNQRARNHVPRKLPSRTGRNDDPNRAPSRRPSSPSYSSSTSHGTRLFSPPTQSDSAATDRSSARRGKKGHRIPERTVVIRPRVGPPSPLSRQSSMPRRPPPSRPPSFASKPSLPRVAMQRHNPSTTHHLTIVKSDRQKQTKVERQKDGRLRRFKDKLSIIFHHHHHHHHHDSSSAVEADEDPNARHHHRSLWKYIRGKVHRGSKDDHLKRSIEIYGERGAERAAPQDHQHHGYLHSLLEGLVRHLWHSRKPKSAKAEHKRLARSVGGRVHAKKLHWWQRFRRHGGVKLSNRKKPRLRLGFGKTSKPKS